jgi:dTMP kinase
VDSSLAYQGAGRELGIESVRAINEFATGSLTPELTLLLDLDPDLGRARSEERATPLDRLEREDRDFFARIAAAYRELAADAPDRIRTLDATQPPDAVVRQALAALDGTLGQAATQSG